MARLGLFRFNNNRSVRFGLESFALPVALNAKKKNTIYTNYLSQLKGTKNKLLPEPEPMDKHGYDHIARWGNWLFAADSTGIYIADQYLLNFAVVDQTMCPNQIYVAHNRLFTISMNRRRLVYSVDLQKNWTPENLMSGNIHLPESYGLCLNLTFYHNNLLVICENGLLTVNKSLRLSHLSDDNEIQLANLQPGVEPLWESAWFSLGYATDTQILREVFLKTNQPLVLTVTSNRTQRNIRVKAADGVQKIKTNLNGDQFKITIKVSGEDFCISDLSAVIMYGKRG